MLLYDVVWVFGSPAMTPLTGGESVMVEVATSNVVTGPLKCVALKSISYLQSPANVFLGNYPPKEVSVPSHPSLKHKSPAFLTHSLTRAICSLPSPGSCSRGPGTSCPAPTPSRSWA